MRLMLIASIPFKVRRAVLKELNPMLLKYFTCRSCALLGSCLLALSALMAGVYVTFLSTSTTRRV